MDWWDLIIPDLVNSLITTVWRPNINAKLNVTMFILIYNFLVRVPQNLLIFFSIFYEILAFSCDEKKKCVLWFIDNNNDPPRPLHPRRWQKKYFILRVSQPCSPCWTYWFLHSLTCWPLILHVAGQTSVHGMLAYFSHKLKTHAHFNSPLCY